jgi:hypothetical protein
MSNETANKPTAADPTVLAGGDTGTASAGAANASSTTTTATLLGDSGEGAKGAQGDAGGKEKTGDSATAKSGDGAAAALDIKLPEGIEVDKNTLEWFRTTATEQKLTPEQASKVVEGFAGLQEKQRQALEVEPKDWERSLVEDPEVGGQKWAESKQTALTAVKRFASAGFVNLLNETGLGSHPDVVKTFIAIGRAIREDNNAGSRAGAGQPAQLTDRELNDLRFPSSKSVGR